MSRGLGDVYKRQGLIVTLEVMVAGGMIFNIDFHSADMVAVVMGFMVLYAGIVAILTDN